MCEDVFKMDGEYMDYLCRFLMAHRKKYMDINEDVTITTMALESEDIPDGRRWAVVKVSLMTEEELNKRC